MARRCELPLALPPIGERSHGAQKTLLYVSAWYDGPARGGFLSAVQLLGELSHWSPILWVGYGREQEARLFTEVPLVTPGYACAPSRKGQVMYRAIIRDVLALMKLIREKRIRFIVCDYQIYIPSAIASYLLGIPFAIYVRDLPNRARKVKKLVNTFVLKRGLFLSGKLRDTCEPMIRFGRRWQSAVVPNSLSRSLISQRTTGRGNHHTYVDIGLVGAVSIKKNQLWFFENVYPLIAGQPGIRVHVFGHAPEAEYIETIHAVLKDKDPEGRVSFHGFLDDPFLIYSQFDVLVQCSVREGVARAVLESATFGIPVVAMRIPGVEEYVVHGVTGCIANNSSEMAAYILELATDVNRRHSLGINAGQFVRQRHNPACVGKTFSEVLNKWYRPYTQDITPQNAG